jgi:hypothetical protein
MHDSYDRQWPLVITVLGVSGLGPLRRYYLRAQPAEFSFVLSTVSPAEPS